MRLTFCGSNSVSTPLSVRERVTCPVSRADWTALSIRSFSCIVQPIKLSNAILSPQKVKTAAPSGIY